MRKQDIKPGVVYAYREGKYGETLPVVFLATDFYKGRDYRDEDGPKFRKAGAADAPHSDRLGSPTTGYLVAIMRHQYGRKVDYDAAAERMAKVTLADMEATGGESLDDLIGFMLLVRLGVVIGPWGEVMAQQREEAEEKKRRQEIISATAKALDDRAAKVRLVLIAKGVSPRFSTTARDLILSLEDAEKLASLLAAKDGVD